jgi:hypothetical protein
MQGDHPQAATVNLRCQQPRVNRPVDVVSEVTVRVKRSWIEEPVGSGGSTRRRRIFQVQLEDGRRCRLAQQPDGSWTLAHTAYSR